jgi:hypothetical protein
MWMPLRWQLSDVLSCLEAASRPALLKGTHAAKFCSALREGLVAVLPGFRGREDRRKPFLEDSAVRVLQGFIEFLAESFPVSITDKLDSGIAVSPAHALGKSAEKNISGRQPWLKSC